MSSAERLQNRHALLIIPLVALLAIAVWGAIYAWNAIDVEMSVHGYVAMILGIGFSLLVGCGTKQHHQLKVTPITGPC